MLIRFINIFLLTYKSFFLNTLYCRHKSLVSAALYINCVYKSHNVLNCDSGCVWNNGSVDDVSPRVAHQIPDPQISTV